MFILFYVRFNSLAYLKLYESVYPAILGTTIRQCSRLTDPSFFWLCLGKTWLVARMTRIFWVIDLSRAHRDTRTTGRLLVPTTPLDKPPRGLQLRLLFEIIISSNYTAFPVICILKLEWKPSDEICDLLFSSIFINAI